MIMIEKHCHFCTNSIKNIDYKETETLKQFIDPLGRVLARKKTGVCAKHQRKLSQAIKRARFLSLLPFVEN
jgi:small subunit ribosomal protein S18